MTSRKRLLLGLAAVLLLLRFVLVPLLDWQNRLASENRQLAQNLAKAHHLLTDQQAQARLLALQEREQALRQRLPEEQTDLDLQITTNEWLDRTLTAHGLHENTRAWSFADQSPRLAEVRLVLSGHFYDLLQWLHVLESAPRHILVAEIQITRGSQPSEVNANMILRQYILGADND